METATAVTIATLNSEIAAAVEQALASGATDATEAALDAALARAREQGVEGGELQELERLLRATLASLPEHASIEALSQAFAQILVRTPALETSTADRAGSEPAHVGNSERADARSTAAASDPVPQLQQSGSTASARSQDSGSRSR